MFNLSLACGWAAATQFISPAEQENHFTNSTSFQEAKGLVEAVID